MTPTEKQIRQILIEEPCTFGESVKRIEDLIQQERKAGVENACKAYCKVCDTKECHEEGTCSWVNLFREAMETNNKQ